METPILCSSPGVETHLQAVEARLAKRPMYLTTSPEFHMKRLIAVGFERIFQVTRAFRDGERGQMHNPEFTIVEWYRAYEDYRAIMEDCEALLNYLCLGLYGEDSVPRPGGRPYPIKPPFRRVTFRQAFEEAGVSEVLTLGVEERLETLVTRVEPRLGLSGPEFLCDYPKDMASLARLKVEDPNVAERFELYADGIEIANGFTEICDADEYLSRCQAHLEERRRLGLPLYPIDEHYVTALRNGLPPCAGVALGFDRLVMLLCGVRDIALAMAFPIEEA